MSPRFTINFRREALRREAAKARRRTLMLAGWLSYFGVLALLIGFYGLNWMSLVNRARQLERRTVAARALREHGGPWDGAQADVAEVERYTENPRRWRDRLVRLAGMLPPGVRLASLALDPNNVATTGGPALVVVGQARRTAGQDRLKEVMELVSAMRRDSVFAADYPNVRLASTLPGKHLFHRLDGQVEVQRGVLQRDEPVLEVKGKSLVVHGPDVDRKDS